MNFKNYLYIIIIFSLIISIYPIWLYGEVLGFENEQIANGKSNFNELTILNPHSSPGAGDSWEVSFETKGVGDLIITPQDQATIDDLDFISLRCGGEERIPRILEDDVIYYPDWECGTESGLAAHYVKKAGKHTLKFQSGDQIKYTYNSPGWVSPTGFIDGSNAWTDEANIYDEDTGTLGYTPVDYFLELTLDSAIDCDKIRIFADRWRSGYPIEDASVDIDLYYSSSWNHLYDGSITKGIWVEKAIGSTESVEKARIHWNYVGLWRLRVYEFDFNKVVTGYEMGSDSYRVWQSSINVGGYGGSQTSTSYHLRETIGEIATGLSTSTLYKLFAGYQPMQEVYLALSAPSQVSMSPSIGGVTGGQSDGLATTTVITDSPSGYSLSVRASSSPAMATSSYSFADYIPAAAGTPDYSWSIPATSSEFGFTSEGSDIVQKFLDNGSNTCATSTNETTDACWYNFSTSNETIAQTYSTNHPSGTQTIIKFKAESGTQNIQAPGEYQATITITAIPN